MYELSDLGSSIDTNPSALCFLQKMDLQLECLRDCNRALQISSNYAKVKLISYHIMFVDTPYNPLVVRSSLIAMSYVLFFFFFFLFYRHGIEEVKQMLVWEIFMMLSVTFKCLRVWRYHSMERNR